MIFFSEIFSKNVNIILFGIGLHHNLFWSQKNVCFETIQIATDQMHCSNFEQISFIKFSVIEKSKSFKIYRCECVRRSMFY